MRRCSGREHLAPDLHTSDCDHDSAVSIRLCGPVDVLNDRCNRHVQIRRLRGF
jgi:hypothetical protein